MKMKARCCSPRLASSFCPQLGRGSVPQRVGERGGTVSLSHAEMGPPRFAEQHLLLGWEQAAETHSPICQPGTTLQVGGKKGPGEEILPPISSVLPFFHRTLAKPRGGMYFLEKAEHEGIWGGDRERDVSSYPALATPFHPEAARTFTL